MRALAETKVAIEEACSDSLHLVSMEDLETKDLVKVPENEKKINTGVNFKQLMLISK